MNKQLVQLTTFLLVLFALPVAGWAQETGSGTGTEAQTIPAQVDEAESLVERIRRTDGELVDLIEEVSVAEGEDLFILRSRISELAGQQRSDLTALIDLMEDRSSSGADITLLEQEGEQLLRRASRRLRNYIQLFQAALEREATRRPALTPSEVQVFEHRMAEDTNRLDGFYLALVQLTEQMMTLGLGLEEEDAFLRRELGNRGQNLLQILDLSKTRLAEYRRLLENAPDDGDLRAQAFAAEERYEANKASLLATIHLMRTRGMDYVDLEVRAIEITGDITPDALEVDVAVGLFAREIERTRAFLAERGPRLLLQAMVIVIILSIFWVLARLTRRITHKVLARTKISSSSLLKDMVVKMAGRLVILAGLIVALSWMGINLGPVLAGLGIAGFIIGFALQETLANFAAGAMILAYRPFDVGDLVEAAGVTGKVKDMNIVSTRILTVDHQTLIVPNSKIWGDVIRNVTAQPQRRVDMVFGISYEDEIPEAERILGEIVAAHEKVLDDPEPVIKVHTLNDSSVDLIVRPWAKTEDYWDVYWDITREVKMRFDREGVSIPFPQRDVHLTTPAGTPAAG
jgi:small conductance mechanosensitive channel